MIFFSSDQDFKEFYQKFTQAGLKIDALITESPKKQGRAGKVLPNAAHQFANSVELKTLYFDRLDQQAQSQIQELTGEDRLGFIFAYGKIIPKKIIDLFENGILNIHFSLLPEFPGASPIQQALLEDKKETGYSVFEITDKLDQGLILTQEKTSILPDDNFVTLRSRIITDASGKLAPIIKKYLKWQIKLSPMKKPTGHLTHRISKADGELTFKDSARSAYNKYRAYFRWPKVYFIIEGKRLIIHEARLNKNQLEIIKIQLEGKKVLDFNAFRNGYQTLLTKLPPFVKIS